MELHKCLTANSGEWDFGGIGLSGVFFEKCRGSTQSSLSRCGKDALHRLRDGGLFLDKRTCDRLVLVEGVCNGPMLSLRLRADEAELFDEHACLERMEPALGDGFKTLAQHALANRQWRGFDKVGLNIYLAFWRDRGARIGQRQGNEMHWEDGVIDPIQPCECWRKICLGCNKLRYYVDRDPDSLITQARQPLGPEDHCPKCRAAR
jgi:hypothetical protein